MNRITIPVLNAIYALLLSLLRFVEDIHPTMPPRRAFLPLLPGLTTEVYHPELIEALGYNKAVILRKIWDWQEHNRREKQTFKNGHYWTYYTYEQWQQRHFRWLNVDTVRKLICEMEASKLLISGQFSHGSAIKWYRVDLKAVTMLVQGADKSSARVEKLPAASGRKTRKGGSETRQGGEESRLKTTENPQSGNLQTESPNLKQQQQPTAETDVDVVPPALPHHEPEAESGEHSIDGEGHDVAAVKAFVPHEQHHDEASLSKVPLKVLSPLVAELVAFGVISDTAQRLVAEHSEATIRHVLQYARAAKNLFNPPGFVVDTLDDGKAGSLPSVRAQPNSPTLDAARLEAMRRETERILEDPAGQTLSPEPYPEGV